MKTYKLIKKYPGSPKLDDILTSRAIKFYWGIKAKHYPEYWKKLKNFKNMVFVKGGTFQMGSDDGNSDEKPIHSVTVSDFYISKYEVTVNEYMKFANETNSHFPEWKEKNSNYNVDTGTDDHYKRIGDALKKGNNPIVGISWNDAVAYCKWLSQKTGQTYRLPTEAEWEYAARGGTNYTDYYTYSGSNTIDDVAWYSSNSSSHTHTVGTKTANQLGIYDMSGNVWEWCSDKWHDNYEEAPTDGSAWENGSGSSRVHRGGSWGSNANGCRVAFRSYGGSPNNCNYIGGFRIIFDIKTLIN